MNKSTAVSDVVYGGGERVNKLKETIDWVEKKIANFIRAQEYYGNKNEIPPILTIEGKMFFIRILKILQAVESAGGELGEKAPKEPKFDDKGFTIDGRTLEQIAVFNQAIDIATPIIVKDKLRIKEMRLKILELEESVYSLGKSSTEAITQLQSLKEKLTVEKVYPQLNGQDIPLSIVLRSIDAITMKDLLKLLEPNIEFIAQTFIKKLKE